MALGDQLGLVDVWSAAADTAELSIHWLKSDVAMFGTNLS